MKLFDLHCDTLWRSLKNDTDFFKNDFHIDIQRGAKYQDWTQCFAIFIDDVYRGKSAFDFAEAGIKKFYREVKKLNGKLLPCKNARELQSGDFAGICRGIITIEGGAALAGKLENLKKLYDFGVRLMTLTWNGKNEIGDGALVKEPAGLTDFGVEVVREMEKIGMVIDVSHASDKLFYDVVERSTRPFAASHSNSRTICGHPRNLTDDQFKIIKDRGGIVGLNFSISFLNNNKNSATLEDIITHAEHFLSLGGEKTIAFGSDFDGTDMPPQITGIESMSTLYEAFLKKNFNQTLVDDIFYNNAYNFFKRVIS